MHTRFKISVLALGPVLWVFLFSDLQAQSLSEQIRRAANSNEQGNFRETIKLLTPLLQSQGQRNEPILGIGWNINGLALQSTGDEDGAMRSYEKAIEILHRTPTEKVNLAAALDNLGSLKAETGELVESESLRMSAKALYQSVGDHAGVARTSINLAVIALDQRNRNHVRRFLNDAFSEEAQVAAPKDALISINKAIQLWMEHYGPRYYLLAIGYALRGLLEAKLDDREPAVNDYEHSLEILRLHGDGASQRYFLIEASYAKSLQKLGDAQRCEAFG